ncbi:hypothetical protein TRFO_24908 [Tritrichomonas foetus]|uniref:DUF3447 domain-containing protein n=1 Tax=Tritrichomonas foetus TaxID=1144522 RepID=A0A1J4K7G7_9EUKA|nr:hypothetical protein TRFO_24908 [Tritrichomonas foetus]|eukprot:OHT06946.1 hypothetical protein TRFO_24908 [Tritrichomonas foetus]
MNFMFRILFLDKTDARRKNKIMDFVEIQINDHIIKCKKKLAMNISPLIAHYFNDHLESMKFQIDIPEIRNLSSENDFIYISRIFESKPVFITFRNKDFLLLLSKHLEIPEIEEKIELFSRIIEHIEADESVSLYNDFFKSLLSLNESNFAVLKENIKTGIYRSLDLYLLSNTFLTACEISPNKIEIIIEMIISLDQELENGFLSIFIDCVVADITNNVYIHENSFIIRFLRSKGKVSMEEINDKIQQIEEVWGKHVFQKIRQPVFLDEFNINKLNNLLKSSDITGISPDSAYQILKNDDIDSLLNYVKSLDFDFESSTKVYLPLYDRFDIFKKQKRNNIRQFQYEKLYINYLDVCAYFGSGKCFDYLLLNNAKITDNTLNLAIAGGNIDIIHKIEQVQEIEVTKKLIMNAIHYHRNDILEWLIEKLDFYNIEVSGTHKLSFHDIVNTDSYLVKAIKYYNVDAISYLVGNGVDCQNVFSYSMVYDIFILSRLFLSIEHSKIYNPLKPSYHNEPPLHIAAFKNHLEIASDLIYKYKVKLDQNWKDKLAIEIALQEGNMEMVNFLFNSKLLKLNIPQHSTLIHMSLKKKQYTFLDTLLENTKYYKCVDKHKRSLLQCAIKYEHDELVWKILNNSTVNCFTFDDKI